jgi:hypothetical protein
VANWKVGDRVEGVEQLGLSKVIEVGTDQNEGYYRVRQYAHPHAITWIHEYDLTTPTEMRHDPRAPLFEDEF